jgi:hypothetical protein
MKATYKGATTEQVRFGSCDDPSDILDIGTEYEVEQRDVRGYHTKIKLVNIEGWFNSVCFDVMPTEKQADETVSAQAPLQTEFGAWLPIGAAPNDGRLILTYDMENKPDFAFELRAADGDFWRMHEVGPTHWMPLPLAPGQIEERASATRTAQPDGSQHDTNKLDEAKEIISGEIQRREQAEEELECLSMVLDDAGVPTHEGNRKLSLVGRVEKHVQTIKGNSNG